MTQPLKCYFAFSNDIERNQCYIDMLRAGLSSARKNTTLDLYCLYDGDEDDYLYSLLMEYNVKVKIAKISFLSQLKKIYTPAYMMEKFGFVISELSLRSRFLRMLISEYEPDDYVLYCDTDVLFLKDISLSDFTALPEYIGVCSEFDKSNDYSYFNAGVMLINIKNAKTKYQEFLELINKGEKAPIECCDQGYLNTLYENKFDRLPPEYNWKPYWGINENAKILHFHGIKPNSEILKPVDFWKYTMKSIDSKAAYFFYYGLFCDYANIDKKECYEKLVQTLLIGLPVQNLYNDNKKRINRLKKQLIVSNLFFVLLGMFFMIYISIH